MSDGPDSLMLVYLRRLDAKMDRLTEGVVDMKGRISRLEVQVGQGLANEQAHYAATMSRIDRIEGRLDRIEHRIDLVPG